MKFKCQERIDEMKEINGKTDIMRWEALYEYGRVFLDVDSICICIEPIDDALMNTKCFAGWEHEELRPGLIATSNWYNGISTQTSFSERYDMLYD